MKCHKLLIVLVLFSSMVFGQDAEFSQYFTTKTYLNPSLVGIDERISITSVYRNQWPSVSDAYITHFFSVSSAIGKKGHGVGVYFINDQAGSGALRRQALALNYAKTVRLGENLKAGVGVKAGFNRNTINWAKLTWGDMIQPNVGFQLTTAQTQGQEQFNYFDLGCGLSVFNERFFAGTSFEHVNRPQVGFLQIEGENVLPIRIKVHGGARVGLISKPGSSSIEIFPQLMITAQSSAMQLVTGAALSIGPYLSKKKIIVGGLLRVKDSFIMLIGLEHEKYKIAYSFDFGTNELESRSGGAHEVSLNYSFSFKNQSRKVRKRLACPTF